jgi:hypothetical protein
MESAIIDGIQPISNAPQLGKALTQILWYYENEIIQHNLFVKAIDYFIAFIKQFYAKEYGLRIPQENKIDFLFFKSLPQRTDYQEIFCNVTNTVDGRSKIVVDLEEKNHQFVLKYFCRCFFAFFKYFFLLNSIFKWNKSIYLSFWIVRIDNFLKSFDSLTPEVVIVFADMQFLDSVLVQYFNARDIITCTLQHGIYTDFNQKDTIERINLENVVSRYFLSWGNNTKKAIQKYNKKCIPVILGTPKTYNCPTGEKINTFIVVLDHSQFLARNLQLLEIAEKAAEKLDLSFHVKVHPYDRDQKHLYALRYGQFVDDIDRLYKLVLGGKSTYLIELNILGMAILSYEKDAPFMFPEKYRLRCANDVIEALQNTSEYRDLSNEYIASSGDAAIEKYQSFLLSLVN